jgi:hypothetical protein
MLFSQRQGLTPSLKDLQTEEMDEELRTRLWNALTVFYWNNFRGYSGYSGINGSNMEGLMFAFWHFFFKWPVDRMPDKFYRLLPVLREQFFDFEWFRIYDFIEFIIAHTDRQFAYQHTENFPAVCNGILEEENAGYRLIDGRITPITSPTEMQAVEEALAEADAFPGVKAHLAAALRLLSDREQPDYRNSIKESISAVESVCQGLVGDERATLGAALKVLEQHTHIHGALKAGLSSLYGYTSDADGIRHAMLEESSLTFTDAKFMLVTCSGFINYLIGKVAELNIAVPSAT